MNDTPHHAQLLTDVRKPKLHKLTELQTRVAYNYQVTTRYVPTISF